MWQNPTPVSRKPQTEECPHCGTTYRVGRLACPECGSDAETGWRDAEDIDYLAVDLPDADAMETPPRDGRFTLVLILLLLAAFVVAFVLRG